MTAARTCGRAGHKLSCRDVQATGAGGTSKQQKQHSSGVINSLQNTLKKTTAEFMGVVKTRQQVRHTDGAQAGAMKMGGGFPGLCH